MAQFPYLLNVGFETGAVGSGLALTDSESKSSYPHYTDLVAKHGFLPFRGAYCWVLDQSKGGGTTTAAMMTMATFDVADTNYYSVAFAFYAKNTTMADGDRTTIIELDSGTTTNEATLQLYYTTAGGLQLLLTETYATAVGSNPVCPLTEKEWHWVELYGINASAAGTCYLVLDGRAVGSITGLSVGAFTDLYFGLPVIDSTHTAGIYAFDDVIVSGISTTAQVRIGHHNRFPMSMHVSARSNDLDASGYGEHLFLGPGTVKEAVLLTANAGDAIRLYDTDRAYITGDYGLVAECNYSSGMPVVPGPLEFQRGCYCVVIPGGTNGARGVVTIDPSPDCTNKAIYYGFPNNLKQYALTGRSERNGNM